MAFVWIPESPALWNADKQRIVGGAPPGIFRMPEHATGEILPGDWWRVERDGTVVGFGWMDTNWGGDAEVLLAVSPAERGAGVGTFILDQLDREASTRGLNYLYNVVQPTHPDAAAVTRWLEQRHFKAAHDGALLRKVAKRTS